MTELGTPRTLGNPGSAGPESGDAHPAESFIVIGHLRVSVLDDKTVWIGRVGCDREGEGGGFPALEVEGILENYYEARF